MNDERNKDGTFADPYVEAAYQAYSNSSSGEEKLSVLSFIGGVDPQTAITRIAFNAPEVVVRATLAGLLGGLLSAGRGDTVMALIQDMALAAIKMEEEQDG